VSKISLEETTNESFEKLQKRYLKEAAKACNDEFWKENRNYILAYMGMGVGSFGTCASMFTGSVWPMVFGGAGIATMVSAWIDKRNAKQDTVKALKEVTSKMGYEELETRLANRNFSLPMLDSGGLNDFEMVIYASEVSQHVYEKEKGLKHYSWPLAGTGIAAYGLYEASTGSSIAGGLTLTAGSIIFLASYAIKKRGMNKLGLKVFNFLKEKGFDFYERYARNRDPYEFYQRFIKKEAQSKAAK
jgi:hypothetical protein